MPEGRSEPDKDSGALESDTVPGEPWALEPTGAWIGSTGATGDIFPALSLNWAFFYAKLLIYASGLQTLEPISLPLALK